MVHNAIVMWATFTGVGTKDEKLNTPVMIEGAKVRLPLRNGELASFGCFIPC